MKNIEILIVEDSLTQALALQFILEQHDYQVSVAANGMEALAFLRQHKPTLVISDIVMPEMDGYEFCRQIRADHHLKDLPVILLTALSNPTDIIRGLECGANNFITKPYDEHYLLSRIQYILTNQELRTGVKAEMGINVFFAGEQHFITAERMQILDLLLSIYEAAIQQNNELVKTRDELQELNERLDERVAERTAALTAEIAGRKRMEEHLLKLRKAVESSGEVIFMTSAEGIITFVNPEFTRLYGYTSDEVVGKVTPRILKSGRMPQEAYEIFWKTILSKQIVKGELVNKTKDGRFIDVESSANPILDDTGAIVGFLAVQQDITKRKRVEELLQESEERYRQLVEHSPDAIAVHSDGRLVFINSAVVKLLGATDPEDLIGKPVIEFVHPDYRERVRERERQVIEEGKAAASFEEQLIRLDGTVVDVEVIAMPFTYQKKPAVQTIARDITERKRLEAQFLQAQKMEILGRLSGGVAHDFNNLLTVINSYSSFLLSDLDKNDPKRADVEEIKKAADRAAGLTRQLLAFSRRQVLEPYILDLNEVLTNLDKMLRRLIGEDIDLVILPTKDLGMVKIDPGQVEQVIMNLVVNARDAIPQGGCLTIETANVELDADYARIHIEVVPGPYVMLAVSDTGVGMSPEVQARIFEPFFTTKEQGKGTGLGLSTVYGIVKQSGGHISVYSEEGHGTTFKIYLPCVETMEDTLVRSGESGRPSGGTETILLVEDDEAIRKLSLRTLTSLGYTVLEASHGTEALQLCEQVAGPLHLLLTDIIMPGMTGKDLAERVQTLKPGLKVLYMSGYTNDVLLHNGVLEAKMSFLTKPFSPEVLASKVRTVLDSSRRNNL